jgi:hypothetical protein
MNVQLHNTIKHYRKILVEDLRNQPESVRNHYVKRFDVASKMAVYDLKKLGLYESWKLAPASNNLFLTEIKGINNKLVGKLPKEISYPLQSQIDAVEELVGFYNELGKGEQGKDKQNKLEAFAKDFGIDSGLTFKEEVKALRNELVGLFKEIENEGIFSKIKRAGERFVARVTGAGSVQKTRLNVDEVVGALAAKKAAALAAQQAGIITAAKPAAVAAAAAAKPAAAAAVAGKAALGLGSALAGGAAAAVGAAGMGLIYGLVKSRDLNKRKDKIERLQDIANAFILQNKLKMPKVDQDIPVATESPKPAETAASSTETGAGGGEVTGGDATGGAGAGTGAGGGGGVAPVPEKTIDRVRKSGITGPRDRENAFKLLGLEPDAALEQIKAAADKLGAEIKRERDEYTKQGSEAFRKFLQAKTSLGLIEQIKREIRKAMLQELKKLKKVSRR